MKEKVIVSRDSSSTGDDWAAFQKLAKSWHEERGATSHAHKMAECPSYQQIIGMGDKAIGLILRRLKEEGNEPDHWFFALGALTGENPVPDEARGNMEAVAQAWLAWGSEHGYVSTRHRMREFFARVKTRLPPIFK